MGEITDIVKVQKYVNGAETAVQEHVGHYDYDPYGLITEVSTYENDNFAEINPIRYKGYYYDTDLNWYNLEARYYDPTIDRFINADDLSLLTETDGDITDKNLYNYCDNNPIMRVDCTGDAWQAIVVAFGTGAAVSVSLEVVLCKLTGEEITPMNLVVAGISGGLGASTGYTISGLVAIGTGIYDARKDYMTYGNPAAALTVYHISATCSFMGGMTGTKVGKHVEETALQSRFVNKVLLKRNPKVQTKKNKPTKKWPWKKRGRRGKVYIKSGIYRGLASSLTGIGLKFLYRGNSAYGKRRKK